MSNRGCNFNSTNNSTNIYTVDDIGDIRIKGIVPRIDRRPKDVSKLLHKLSDMYFKTKFGIAYRSNSFFCTGNKSFASDYGSVCLIFPIGDFNFCWSPAVHDFYSPSLNDVYERHEIDCIIAVENEFDVRMEYDGSWIDNVTNEYLGYFEGEIMHEIVENELFKKISTYMDKKEYKNTDLSAAILSGNEIMLSCKKAFLVDMPKEDMGYFFDDLKRMVRG